MLDESGFGAATEMGLFALDKGLYMKKIIQVNQSIYIYNH